MEDSVSHKISTFFAPFQKKKFGKGQILIYSGDMPQGIFFLEKGQVRQYDINKKGNEIVVNVFKAPSFFPISWLLNNTHNYYFYETYTPAEVRIAPPKLVMDFITDNNDVVLDLLSRVYHGVDGIERRMAHLMGGSAHGRIIFELIVECKRFGQRQNDGSYILNIHEDELANRSGLARETISRHLTKLNHGTLIRITHKNIIIRNLKQLEDELGDSI